MIHRTRYVEEKAPPPLLPEKEKREALEAMRGRSWSGPAKPQIVKKGG